MTSTIAGKSILHPKRTPKWPQSTTGFEWKDDRRWRPFSPWECRQLAKLRPGEKLTLMREFEAVEVELTDAS